MKPSGKPRAPGSHACKSPEHPRVQQLSQTGLGPLVLSSNWWDFSQTAAIPRKAFVSSLAVLVQHRLRGTRVPCSGEEVSYGEAAGGLEPRGACQGTGTSQEVFDGGRSGDRRQSVHPAHGRCPLPLVCPGKDHAAPFVLQAHYEWHGTEQTDSGEEVGGPLPPLQHRAPGS